MKKIFLCFAFLFVPAAGAQNFDASDLENAYLRIYDEVNAETVPEVLARVSQHPFARENGFNFSELEKLSNLEAVLVAVERGVSKRKSSEITAKFKEIYDREREFLRLENDLRRTNGLKSVFANGTLVDGSFDIIWDLDRLDRALFGEGAEVSDPKFSEVYYSSEDFYQRPFVVDLDENRWQDQHQKGEIKEQTQLCGEFGGAGGLSAELAEICEPLKYLNRFALQTGCSTREVLRVPTLAANAVPARSREWASDLHRVPFPFLARPEVAEPSESVRNFWSEMTRTFFESSCSEVLGQMRELGAEGGKDSSETFLAAVESCERERRARAEILEKSWDSDLRFAQTQLHADLIEPQIKRFAADFYFWKLSVQKWRQNAFEFLAQLSFFP